MVVELEVVEKTPKKLRVRVDGENHTLLNVLRDKAWQAKVDQAGYIVEHPYLSSPEIIIRSKNPKKTLNDAADFVIADCKAFLREVKKSKK